MGATSIHVQAVKPGSEIHNFREKELDYVRPELSHLNESWVGDSISHRLESAKQRYLDTVGQKMQAKAAPIREGVIVIKQETTMQELQQFATVCKERFGIEAFQIHIHKDEGYMNAKQWTPNLHAHVVFDWTQPNGKSVRLSRDDMAELQTIWYAKAPWGVCSKGLPVRVVRRRATLPHPVGCSTIAVPGLSFRVRNGTGRLSWAMAAANLLLYGQTLGSAGLWRPGNRTADADMSMFRLVARQCSLPSGAVCRRKMRSNRQGLECWCCLSSVSTGRLHPSRGFHVRPIDHVFCMGTTGTRRFHGMLILEQASRLDAFSGYPFRT